MSLVLRSQAGMKMPSRPLGFRTVSSVNPQTCLNCRP